MLRALLLTTALTTARAVAGCFPSLDGFDAGATATSAGSTSGSGGAASSSVSTTSSSGATGGGGAGGGDAGPKLPDMVFVEAGAFMMGCADGSPEYCPAQEQPLHQVELDSYWIDTTEVTQQDYAACVDAGVCNVPSTGWFDAGANGEPPDRLPVGGVNWEDAVAYCAQFKNGKRLPTEAEWEHAARGPADCITPWCSPDPNATTCLQAQIRSCGTVAPGSPRPVGELPAGKSAYGAYDMEGNVSEWVSDWYQGDYYSTSPLQNPQGPDAGSTKCARGSTYQNTGSGIYSSHYRQRRHQPHTTVPQTMGFRCAETPDGG